jgi:hypothetical protein
MDRAVAMNLEAAAMESRDPLLEVSGLSLCRGRAAEGQADQNK